MKALRSIIAAVAAATALSFAHAAPPSESDMTGALQKMQQQIHEIHMAKDAGLRAELMQEHMQLMLDVMASMQKAGAAVPTGSGADVPKGDARRNIERRTEMMQMIMVQMLQHQQALERALK